MKHSSSAQKTSRTAAQIASLDAATGRSGLTIAPPAYGMDVVDQQPIQAMFKPRHDLQALPSASWPAWNGTTQRRIGPPGAGDSTSKTHLENRTGLPDHLKTGIETLSGLFMDNVRVHYNSAKPAQVRALAYTQGTNIYVGPGQERHLPHEAWHVAQQKQGRVWPTIQTKGMAINDDQRLEKEAAVMGAKAIQVMPGNIQDKTALEPQKYPALLPVATNMPNVIQMIEYADAVTGKFYLVGGGRHQLTEKRHGGWLYFATLGRSVRASEVEEEESEESSDIGSETEAEMEAAYGAIKGQRKGPNRQAERVARLSNLDVFKHIHAQPALHGAMIAAMGEGSAVQGTVALGRTGSGTEFPISLSASAPLSAFFQAHGTQPMEVTRAHYGTGSHVHAEMHTLHTVAQQGSSLARIWVSKGICPICAAVLTAFGVPFGQDAARLEFADGWRNPFDRSTEYANWKKAADAARAANVGNQTTLYNC